MGLSQDEIFEKVQDALIDALGADDDEVNRGATLVGDLGAESIDFLDIVFRIEKTFDVKISQGELFPENLADNADWVADGKLTDVGLEMLKGRMAHVDFAVFEGGDRSVSKLGDAITVDSLVNFVEIKLAG